MGRGRRLSDWNGKHYTALLNHWKGELCPPGPAARSPSPLAGYKTIARGRSPPCLQLPPKRQTRVSGNSPPWSGFAPFCLPSQGRVLPRKRCLELGVFVRLLQGLGPLCYLTVSSSKRRGKSGGASGEVQELSPPNHPNSPPWAPAAQAVVWLHGSHPVPGPCVQAVVSWPGEHLGGCGGGQRSGTFLSPKDGDAMSHRLPPALCPASEAVGTPPSGCTRLDPSAHWGPLSARLALAGDDVSMQLSQAG